MGTGKFNLKINEGIKRENNWRDERGNKCQEKRETESKLIKRM